MTRLYTSTDMAADHHIVICAGFPQRIPIIAVDRRITMNSRVVGQRQRMHAQLGHAHDLSGGGLHVPPRHQHQRNEATRRGIAPVVQMPVVVGLDGCEGNRAIGMYLEALTGKTGEGREAQ
ncbi:hypothetical protein D3C81_1619430 [compost metagenome]